MVCVVQRLQAQTSVISYTSVNICNFNSCLAHLYALWMEYVRFELESWWNILWYYLGWAFTIEIKQTSEVIRVTYKMCWAGGHEDWNWEPLIYTQRVFSRSCLPGCFKSQMSAFEVVGAFLINAPWKASVHYNRLWSITEPIPNRPRLHRDAPYKWFISTPPKCLLSKVKWTSRALHSQCMLVNHIIYL